MMKACIRMASQMVDRQIDHGHTGQSMSDIPLSLVRASQPEVSLASATWLKLVFKWIEAGLVSCPSYKPCPFVQVG
jgi:hypothetical protein